MAELASQRILPALPGADSLTGPIRWDGWRPALLITHIDPRCPTCAFAGPLSTARGMTRHVPEPTWARAERSRPGSRSRWVRVQRDPYWCDTHWALRCPQCDETTVWRMSDWEEIHHQPPTTERAVPPADDVLF